MEYQPEEHTENRTVAMGGKIYSLRMAKEMTQEQLAGVLCVSPGQYQNGSATWQTRI